MFNKKQAIIVDIDGTLANCDHRRHFVDGTEPQQDWRSFYESMTEDTINEWCHEIIRKFYNESRRQEHGCPSPDKIYILLVSGRPEEYRYLTNKWLYENSYFSPFLDDTTGGYYEKVFMRKTGDYRDDIIIKEEIYRERIEPHYDVLFVIDDRAKVVKKWRELGLVALHCANGDF